MIDYSQNGEQKIILNYFKGQYKGSLLDIGANDGITLSNCRALIERGWNGVMIEPGPKSFKNLIRNNHGYPVLSVECAIGMETGEMELLESDSHLVKGNNNNLGLLSTLIKSEVERWKGTQKFTPVKVKVFDWKTFIKQLSLEDVKFDFISIDAEGLDVEILKQIDLTDVQMVCIEFNSNEERKREIIHYCGAYGLYIHYENFENVILTR